MLGIAAIVVIARGPDGDRRSFVAALAVALALSPIVWLHYLVLVYVVIALYQRRLGVAWLIPALYWLLPGQDSHGSLALIVRAYLLTVAAAGFAIYASRARNWWQRRAPEPAPGLTSP